MIRMRLASRLSVATILLLSVLSMPSMLIHSVRANPDVVNVSISGFAFNPQNLTILRGDTVVWNNTDQVVYTLWFVNLINESTYLLSEPIAPGTTFAHTFNDEVDLQYFSFERLWITGFLTVIEDSTPPTTVHDYDGLWHTSDFTIQLMATDDLSGVAETYYKINSGPTQNISTHGQPLITTESDNNTMEYWSMDNATNEEFPHNILSGIKLDKTAPTIEDPIRHPEGDITPDQSVRVSVNVTDATSGVKNTTLSYTTDNGTSWIDLPMTYNSTSGLHQTIVPGYPYCTWVRHMIIAYDNAENPTVKDNAGEYYVYHVVPEFPAFMILPLLVFSTLIAVALVKKNRYKVTSRTT